MSELTSSGRRRVDLETALHRLEGDRELLREIIAMFLQEHPSMIEQIRAAIAEQNAGALQRAAHKLKGCVGYIAADDLAQLAYRLECMGRAAALDRAGECFNELLAVLEEVKQALLEKAA